MALAMNWPNIWKKRDRTLFQQDPPARPAVLWLCRPIWLHVFKSFGDRRCSTNSHDQRSVAATAPSTAGVSLPVEPPVCPIWGPAALWASCRRRGPCHSVTASFRTDQTAGERSALCGWPCPPGLGTQPGRRTHTYVDPGLAPSAASIKSQQNDTYSLQIHSLLQ